MESTNKKQPLFWINPNTRINFPHFRIEWHRCEKYELLALCEVKQECGTIYKAGSNCVCLLHSKDFSIVHILTIKGTILNSRHAIRYSDRLKDRATRKCIIPNACHAIRNNDRFEGATIFKCGIPNARHAVRDVDRFKATTTLKGAITNARHAVRDGDRCKFTTIRKGCIANARHAVRNGD